MDRTLIIIIFLASAILLVGAGCDSGITGGVVAPLQPVCNKPYILVGTDCCLDQNDNSICDLDEPSKAECVNQCDSDGCINADYYACVKQPDGCLSKQIFGKVKDKCGVECLADSDCGKNQKCETDKCVEKKDIEFSYFSNGETIVRGDVLEVVFPWARESVDVGIIIENNDAEIEDLGYEFSCSLPGQNRPIIESSNARTQTCYREVFRPSYGGVLVAKVKTIMQAKEPTEDVKFEQEESCGTRITRMEPRNSAAIYLSYKPITEGSLNCIINIRAEKPEIDKDFFFEIQQEGFRYP